MLGDQFLVISLRPFVLDRAHLVRTSGLVQFVHSGEKSFVSTHAPYTVATGLAGEPTAPGMCSGGAVRKKR